MKRDIQKRIFLVKNVKNNDPQEKRKIIKLKVKNLISEFPNLSNPKTRSVVGKDFSSILKKGVKYK